MSKGSRKSLQERQREMLVVMTALSFVEDNELMSESQLRTAKRTLQQLFASSGDNDTLLPVLIDHIRLNRELREEFTEISRVSTRISSGVEILHAKFLYVQKYFNELHVTDEERDDFVDPFSRFSRRFHSYVLRFNLDMRRYLELRETEARRVHDYRAAQEASQRLKERLSGISRSDMLAPGAVEFKSEAVGTFNYEETRRRLTAARKECKAMSRQINSILNDIKGMCQMAMNPDMRDTAAADRAEDLDCEDIFAHFTNSLRTYPRMERIRNFVIDHFRLCQRSYNLLYADYQNFERAVASMVDSPGAYFQAKEDSDDERARRQKLLKYDGLIPFLEVARDIVDHSQPNGVIDWSLQFETLIENDDAPWSHVSALLHSAKDSAESVLQSEARA